jgi:integrase
MAWENSKIDTERPWRIVKLFKNLKPARVLHLSRAECRRLLDHCRPDVGRLVLAALYTGCRVSELMEMRCSHVGRDGYGVYVPPQKGYRPRFVFLPDEGMAWFLQMIKGRRPDDYVFLNDNTNRRIGPSNKPFKAAVRAAGLPEDFTFHGLRHTYASQLAQAGAPILAIADQLGHLSARMVLETYGHLAPQIRESEVRQRFTALSQENVRLAARKKEQLRGWRSSLHGADWRTYATITDLRSRRNSVDNAR